jgi:hypothetical protein
VAELSDQPGRARRVGQLAGFEGGDEVAGRVEVVAGFEAPRPPPRRGPAGPGAGGGRPGGGAGAAAVGGGGA